jgi:CheY-like chemotaxis protein
VSRKVLIVDDSKLARMSVVKVLKTLHPDWSTVEAGDASQALVSAQKESPDFALVDYNMPGKDGLTLAAELREQNEHIGIAVISANHQIEVIQRTEAAGAVFIRKPLNEHTLAEFLRGALGRSQAAQ